MAAAFDRGLLTRYLSPSNPFNVQQQVQLGPLFEVRCGNPIDIPISGVEKWQPCPENLKKFLKLLSLYDFSGRLNCCLPQSIRYSSLLQPSIFD